MLHLEIIQERLDREFDLNLITTAPSVVYRIFMTDGSLKELHNPADMPECASQHRGAVDPRDDPRAGRTSRLHSQAVRRAARRQVELTYAGCRAMVIYKLPLNEVVFDFYDRLKSVSRGYASFDYQIDGYERAIS